MRISASTEYGARILAQLARLPAGDALSAEQVSKLENIPRAYVDQIFHRLRKAGLVDSHRGAQGGYFLARPPHEITIGMMVRAVEGTIFEDVCEKYASGELKCAHTGGCDIKPVWRKLTQMVEGFLDQVTVAQLLQDNAVPFPSSDIAAVLRNSPFVVLSGDAVQAKKISH